MTMIKAICFDFDGVILDSVDVKARAFAKLFENKCKDDIKKIVDYHYANSGMTRFKKIRNIHKEILGEDLPDEQIHNLCNRFASIVFDGVLNAPWVSGAKEFIELNFQTYKFLIISSMPQDELSRIVTIRGISKYFEGVYGYPPTKQKTMNEIIRLYSLTNSQILFLGDALSDYQVAKLVGTRFIGVLTGKNNNFPRNVKTINDLYQLTQFLHS